MLTLRHSTATTAFSIGGGVDGANYDLKYIGKAGASDNKKISVSFVLDLKNGAHNFSAVSGVTLNKKNQLGSNWTNIVPEENGGTEVKIGKFVKASALGANTITIEYDIYVKKWGTEDVIMDLDLDDILTYS